MAVKIYFFGDSICVGQHITVHKAWVTQISQQLEIDFPNKNITVSNPSISGNTTRQALERMSYDVSSHKPDILYIQFGLNDCNFWQTDYGSPRVSLNAYIANLQEIVDRAYCVGVEKILVGTNHCCSKGDEYKKYNRQYYQSLIQHAFNNKCQVLDTRDHIENNLCINDPQVYLLNDGIHLNLKGHKIYFEYIYPIIKDLVVISL
jgi:lysophospholipase L1-like esterase